MIEEVQTAQKVSQEEQKVARRDSFDMQALGATGALNEDDSEIKRLQEDAVADQFKILEKFLRYWLPNTLKNPAAED